MSALPPFLTDDEIEADTVIDASARFAARAVVADPKAHAEAALQEFQREKPRAKKRADTARRKAKKLQRIPPWANLTLIETIYREARRLTRVTGVDHHVDHEIPLQGRLVSGLHVETNLQILTATDNIRKKNHFDVSDA